MRFYWLSLLLLLPMTVLAQGKTLHDASCLQCHSSITSGKANSLYTRAEHKVKTLPALHKRVKGCAVAADVSWSSEQRETVVNYLAKTFYRF